MEEEQSSPDMEDSEEKQATAQNGEVGQEPAPEDEVACLTRELEDVRDLVRRKQAEFENYRKRIERERKDFIDHAASELVSEILPVLDNLERALEAPESANEDRLREGIEITERQFRDILVKSGLREVEALGKEFDPHVHEAVGRIETNDHREGQVLEVYQKGYFFKGKLLRPALVGVAQQPRELDDTETGEKEDSSENDAEVHSDTTRS